ncbi:MAG: DNA (cytosine-5-)-methyltransferase [Clostridia bacterium]|nr:DNA (cytosine-5-)-methyltransferase [Clostridia bacterium]
MRICSLFAGIGGIDLAFVQAGCTVVWANECDHAACETYRYNFPGHTLIEADIQRVVVNDIPDFDILTAGFPCQPFSVCGRQEGFADRRGNLFYEIVRVLEAKKPPVLFLENVANLVEHDNGRTFNVIYSELARLGYYVRYFVADAYEYGIPQHRTRTYIVGFSNREACERFAFPEKRPLEKHIVDVIDLNAKAMPNLYFKCDSPKYKRLNAFIKDTYQIYRFSDYGIQASKDGISFTLKANMGTWYDRVPIVKDKYGIRIITPMECLSLQGYPKAFRYPKTITSRDAYKQAGNTVCVPLVKEIADRIMRVSC